MRSFPNFPGTMRSFGGSLKRSTMPRVLTVMLAAAVAAQMLTSTALAGSNQSIEAARGGAGAFTVEEKLNEAQLRESLRDARQENTLSSAGEGLGTPIVAPAGSNLEAIRTQLTEHDRLSRELLVAKGAKRAEIERKIAQLKQISPQGVTSFNPVHAENGAIFLPFTSFSRDFCKVALVSLGYCHAGMFDRAQYDGSTGSAAIRSANTAANSGGGDGAKYETINYWNNNSYSEVREMTVNVASTPVKNSAVSTARSYSGAYSIATPLWSNARWYCSKLVWRAYWDAGWIPLGPVTLPTPADIRWSPFTTTVRTYV